MPKRGPDVSPIALATETPKGPGPPSVFCRSVSPRLTMPKRGPDVSPIALATEKPKGPGHPSVFCRSVSPRLTMPKRGPDVSPIALATETPKGPGHPSVFHWKIWSKVSANLLREVSPGGTDLRDCVGDRNAEGSGPSFGISLEDLVEGVSQPTSRGQSRRD